MTLAVVFHDIGSSVPRVSSVKVTDGNPHLELANNLFYSQERVASD
jgi:hypothetical protein